MENNKISISLSTVIIIAIIIGALFLGLVSFIIYNNMDKEDSSASVTDNDSVQQSESSNNKNNKEDGVEKNDSTSTIVDNSNKDNNKPITNNSTTAKKSTKASPAAIGEWTLAAKYVSGDYVDVPVKVTSVTRGSSAEQVVKDYCNKGSSMYKYSEPEEGMEWAVIEYQVDLTKMEKDSSVRMDTDITGTGNNNSVKYNGYTYIISTMNMTSGYTKGEIVPCKFATTLPIGCTEYLIEIGSSSHTQAFIKGK